MNLTQADFNKWLANQTAERQQEQVILPCNVDEYKDGTYTVPCCVCGENTEFDPDWAKGYAADEFFEAWCGRTPRCCP